MTLEIYHPNTQGSFTIHEPDLNQIQVQYSQDVGEFILETSRAPGEIEVILFDQENSQVWLEDSNLTLTRTDNEGYRFSYDGRVASRIRVFIKGFSKEGT